MVVGLTSSLMITWESITSSVVQFCAIDWKLKAANTERY